MKVKQTNKNTSSLESVFEEICFYLIYYKIAEKRDFPTVRRL